MENIKEKAEFLRAEFVPAVATIKDDTAPAWGKMNLMQMIEHMALAFRNANGREPQQLVTPEEHLQKMQDFLRSEKPFKENTPNKLLPDEPMPVKSANKEDALKELQGEIDHFFEVFEGQPEKRIMNPFFGNLDYELWILLLHKHATHHLKQFGYAE